MPLRTLSIISLALALPLLAGCGAEDAPPAFTFRVFSADVALGATELLQLRATPREGSFRDEPVGEFLPGLSSRLEGEVWVVEANAGFIADNQVAPRPNTLWGVDIPVYTTQTEQPVMMTPRLEVAVRRAGEEIALSQVGFLPIPLEEGGIQTLEFNCKTIPGPGGVQMPLPQCSAAGE